MKVPEGFIPLIEYEKIYNDKLLISFPSFKYRKGNLIWNSISKSYKEILSVSTCKLTGYRIPKFK